MGDAEGVWERNFRERMERMRTAAGMTQTDLARVLRDQYGLPFHQATIQRIEAGERPIRLNEAHLIAQAFQTDLETMTAAYGTPAVVVSNLLGAAKAFMLRAEETSRFLTEQADSLEWHIREVRKAWDAYAATQQQAGIEADPALADLVNRWEATYQTALEAIGAVVEVGSAENLFGVGEAVANSITAEAGAGRPITAEAVIKVVDAELLNLLALTYSRDAVKLGEIADGVNHQTT